MEPSGGWPRGRESRVACKLAYLLPPSSTGAQRRRAVRAHDATTEPSLDQFDLARNEIDAQASATEEVETEDAVD